MLLLFASSLENRGMEPAGLEPATSWVRSSRSPNWEAVRSTGIELSCLAWLPELVEAQLSEYVDGLEFVLEDAAISAQAHHLHQWPHDHVGAGAAATSAMQERAMGSGLALLCASAASWAPQDRPPQDLEVPALVANGLLKDWPRYGWPPPAEAQRRKPPDQSALPSRATPKPGCGARR